MSNESSTVEPDPAEMAASAVLASRLGPVVSTGFFAADSSQGTYSRRSAWPLPFLSRHARVQRPHCQSHQSCRHLRLRRIRRKR